VKFVPAPHDAEVEAQSADRAAQAPRARSATTCSSPSSRQAAEPARDIGLERLPQGVRRGVLGRRSRAAMAQSGRGRRAPDLVPGYPPLVRLAQPEGGRPARRGRAAVGHSSPMVTKRHYDHYSGAPSPSAARAGELVDQVARAEPSRLPIRTTGSNPRYAADRTAPSVIPSSLAARATSTRSYALARRVSPPVPPGLELATTGGRRASEVDPESARGHEKYFVNMICNVSPITSSDDWIV
jgi:hypothetical protein